MSRFWCHQCKDDPAAEVIGLPGTESMALPFLDLDSFLEHKAQAHGERPGLRYPAHRTIGTAFTVLDKKPLDAAKERA